MDDTHEAEVRMGTMHEVAEVTCGGVAFNVMGGRSEASNTAVGSRTDEDDVIEMIDGGLLLSLEMVICDFSEDEPEDIIMTSVSGARLFGVVGVG
jgi:hypothetical protein